MKKNIKKQNNQAFAKKSPTWKITIETFILASRQSIQKIFLRNLKGNLEEYANNLKLKIDNGNLLIVA